MQLPIKILPILLILISVTVVNPAVLSMQVHEIVKQHPSSPPRRALAQFNFAFVSLQSHCHNLASTFDLLQLDF